MTELKVGDLVVHHYCSISGKRCGDLNKMFRIIKLVGEEKIYARNKDSRGTFAPRDLRLATVEELL